VIIRSDGYILTNNHVVSGASTGGSLSVTTQDGKTYTAQITGTDPTSDLAVVKINATGLRAATFGDSDKLSIGELVVAVGSPLGLNGTVTSGIVSALHRPTRTGDSSVQDENAVLDAIQTDAPINPGNSGGPLVNSAGQLVGINSAIATVDNGGGSPFGGGGQQQSGNIGVGFAIPSNYARTIAEELITKGSATHPYLGVSVATASPNGVTGDGAGALVRQMIPGGPADKAGLKVGDVVTKVDDRRITSLDGLVAAIRSHGVGDAVTLTYTRNGQTSTTRATLTQQRPS
jgi:putative serine protease PepD